MKPRDRAETIAIELYKLDPDSTLIRRYFPALLEQPKPKKGVIRQIIDYFTISFAV